MTSTVTQTTRARQDLRKLPPDRPGHHRDPNRHIREPAGFSGAPGGRVPNRVRRSRMSTSSSSCWRQETIAVSTARGGRDQNGAVFPLQAAGIGKQCSNPLQSTGKEHYSTSAVLRMPPAREGISHTWMPALARAPLMAASSFLISANSSSRYFLVSFRSPTISSFVSTPI